jgi:imidazolonepropionase-like amidohydrolase
MNLPTRPGGPPTSFVLREVRALDAGGGFSEPVDVAVSDGRIRRVGRVPTDADTVDLDASGLWLLPGIFDCHCHLGCFTDDESALAQMDITRWTLECARNARGLLELGVTTVRDVATGTPGMRDAFAAGAVPAPQLQVSGPLIGQTGGHGDGFLPSTGQEAVNGFLIPDYAGRPPYLVDSEDEMRRAIRLHVRSGVDWIKLCTTGGLLSSGRDHPRKPELSEGEVRIGVAEAARAGVPVAVHAYGGEGLDLAVAAGARSIEHGLFLTEEQAAEMARRGCWLVPTLAVCHELDALARAGRIPESAAARVAEIMPLVGQQVAVAREAGVKIALGTDLVRQGDNLSELTLLHRAGLSPEEALLAGTRNGAELCGISDRGTLAEGQVFDALLIDEDPGDLELFSRPGAVSAVFQGGRPVRAHERFVAA